MPAVDIGVDDELASVVECTAERGSARLDASLKTGAIAIAAVEDQAIEQSDRLVLTARADAGDKLGELVASDERKAFRQLVGLHGSGPCQFAS